MILNLFFITFFQVKIHECGNFFAVVWYKENTRNQFSDRVYVYRHHSGVSKVEVEAHHQNNSLKKVFGNKDLNFGTKQVLWKKS